MAFPLLSTASRYFLEVARTGSVSEAALSAHVAPSAISRQVAKLEDALGCLLFERQARGMVLTAAGERLAAYVRAATQDTQRLADELRGLDGQGESRILVACTEGFSVGFMPSAMTSFRALHPGASIHLQVGSPDDVSRWLLRGEAQLGLKFAVEPEKGLQVELQREAPIMALLSPGHALASRRSLSLAQIVAHPLALPAPGTTVRQLFDLCCSVHGLQYDAVYSGNYAALLALVLRAEVLTLASAVSAAHLVEAGLIKAVAVDEPQLGLRSLQLLSLRGRPLAEGARRFADHLARSMGGPAGPRRRGLRTTG